MKAFSKKAFYSLKRITNNKSDTEDYSQRASTSTFSHIEPSSVPSPLNSSSPFQSLPRTTSRQANLFSSSERMNYSSHISSRDSSFQPPKRTTSQVPHPDFSTQVVHTRIQMTTFSRYMNCILLKNSVKPVSSLQDLADGYRFLVITSSLSGHTFNRLLPPVSIENRLNNLNMLYSYLTSLNIPLSPSMPNDILEQNSKTTLGLCFLLILHFHFNPLIRTRPKLKKIDLSSFQPSIHQLNIFPKKGNRLDPAFYLVFACAQTALLNWCEQALAPILGEGAVANFTSSWQSGIAFLALINHVSNELVDLATISDSQEAWGSNLGLAFRLAETKLSIPSLLDAEDIIKVRGEDIESTSVMLYVSMFYHYSVHLAIKKKISSPRPKKPSRPLSEKEQIIAEIRRRSQLMEVAAAERDARLKKDESKRIFVEGTPFPEATVEYDPNNVFYSHPYDFYQQKESTSDESEKIGSHVAPKSSDSTLKIDLPQPSVVLGQEKDSHNEPFQSTEVSLSPLNLTNLTIAEIKINESNLGGKTKTDPTKSDATSASQEVLSRQSHSNVPIQVSEKGSLPKDVNYHALPIKEDTDVTSSSSKKSSEIDSWFKDAEKVEESISLLVSKAEKVVFLISDYNPNDSYHEGTLNNLGIQLEEVIKEFSSLNSGSWIVFVEETFNILHKFKSSPSRDPENQTPVRFSQVEDEATVIKLTFATIENKWNKLEASLHEGEQRLQIIKDQLEAINSIEILEDGIKKDLDAFENLIRSSNSNNYEDLVLEEKKVEVSLKQLKDYVEFSGYPSRKLEKLLDRFHSTIVELESKQAGEIQRTKNIWFQDVETIDFWLSGMEAELDGAVHSLVDQISKEKRLFPREQELVENIESKLNLKQEMKKSNYKSSIAIMRLIENWSADKKIKEEIRTLIETKRNQLDTHWESVQLSLQVIHCLLDQAKVIHSFEQSCTVTERLIKVVGQRVQDPGANEPALAECLPRLKDYAVQIAQLSKATKENPLFHSKGSESDLFLKETHAIFLSLIEQKTAFLQKEISEIETTINSRINNIRGTKFLGGILKQASDIETWISTKNDKLNQMVDTTSVPIDEVLQWQSEVTSIESAAKSYNIALSHFNHQVHKFSSHLESESLAKIQQRKQDINSMWDSLNEKVSECKKVHHSFVKQFQTTLTKHPSIDNFEALMSFKQSPNHEVHSEDNRSLFSIMSSSYSTRSMIPVRKNKSKTPHVPSRSQHQRKISSTSSVSASSIPRRIYPSEGSNRSLTPDYSEYGSYPHLTFGNSYEPDHNDELDVQVANLINQLPYSIRIRKASEDDVPPDETALRPLTSSTSSTRTITKSTHSRPARGQFYWFGEVDPRKYFCKLLSNGTVMVRVGGGYEQLQEFLHNRTKFVKGIPKLQSFQPEYDSSFQSDDVM